MDRRQFFKSSALWLAGLLVAPHLDLISKVNVMPVGGVFARVFLIDNPRMGTEPSNIVEITDRLKQCDCWDLFTIEVMEGECQSESTS